MSEPFKVGETLKCLMYVSRRDNRSSLVPGDVVRVTSEFCFGEDSQDITVQKSHDAPIAVLVAPGRFVRITE